MKKNFTKRLTLLVFLLGMVGSVLAQGGTQNLPLVAETDFSCSMKDPDAALASIDEVDGFGKSFLTPYLTTRLTLAKTTKSTETESDFLSKFQYAVTPNPVRLDAYRFYDNGDNGEWGFVVSGGNNASFQKMLSFDVTGVKNGGKYRVEVDICNPFDSTKIPAGYAAQIRMGVNNTSTSNGQDLVQISSKITKGGWVTASVSGPTQTQEMMAITNNRLTVNLIIGQLPSNQAIMVKGIRVYAEVEPTISGPDEACANGEPIKLTAVTFGQSQTIQWYKDGVKIDGATGQTLTHTPGDAAKKCTYYYKITTPNGDALPSNSFIVNDVICCVDEDGKPISRRLVWQEDFGTFTSDSTYWTWDYSNLNAPKKVTHTDGEKWTTCYGLSIPGAECDKSPSEEGKYTVAGNVTCEYSGATKGTRWGWEAICFNGKYPHENNYPFVPDHTYQGSDFGGMLFLNCGNEANEVIYSKKITGSILKDQNVTARCFVNTFSNAENPVKIFIQLTDLESGAVVKSTTVTRNSINEGLEWKQAVVSSLIEGDSILIEVVSVGGGEEYNRYGNDLILDDIQIFVCGEGTDIPECTQSKEPVIYANGKDVKSIHLKSGETVTLTSNDVTATDISGNPYTNFIMYWYKDSIESTPIKKSTGVVVADSLIVGWGNVAKTGTMYILKVQDNTRNEEGYLVNACNKYDTIVVFADAEPELNLYCETAEGKLIPQILVWQEDFGTFTSDSTYWTWDYSNLNAPKKVTHNDGNKWTSCFGLSIPGTECDIAPSIEGKYTVAGNVTCEYEGVEGGTQWGWEAICFNGKYPHENGYTFVPDHTYQGSDFGGMLFANGGNEADEVIYAKKISSSKLKGNNITARCFVNTFSDALNPVKVFIRLTDLSNGTHVSSNAGVRSTTKDGLAWHEESVSTFMEGDSVLIEIINAVGGNEYNKAGNDLILDDIQLYVCGEETYTPSCTQSKEPVIYANGKDVKSIHLKSGESVTLTTNNVMSENEVGNPYTNYTMSWHKGNAESTPIGKTVGVVADSLVVEWEDATKSGTMYILKVQDNIVSPNGGGSLSSKVINSTSFETVDSLCNPNLSDDEDGWFSENVGKILSDCGTTQEYAKKLLQKGMIAKVSTPSKLFDSKSWQKCVKTQDGTDAGMTAIVRNPKLIDPILWEGNGTNMLVNAGTSHNTDTPFLLYTLSGLRPNSEVQFTADFYYLLDEESLNTYYKLNGLGASDQLFNGMLRANNSGKITAMPDAIIRWTTNLNSNGTPYFYDTNHVIRLAKKTGAQQMTLRGRTDSNGNITFYFGRFNPDNTPIGIDNIEITGTVQDNIVDPNDSESGICYSYDTIVVYADAAPEVETYCLDDQGNQIPQKLVWQEDFGTFTSDSTYWTWDYSDMNEPKKVTHTDGNKWTSCFGLSIPGAECDKSPSAEGKYTVAGNVTCAYDGVEGGTQWGWEAICLNGKYPRENGYTFVPDHTYEGSDFGGMLFLNCGNEPNDAIYTKKISSSKLKGNNITARCFVNTFSDSKNPVEVFIRLTDLSNGNSETSGIVTKGTREGLVWHEANVSAFMEGDSVLIEIISAAGGEDYNRYGNDLILDDIQLYVCDGSEHVGVETLSAEDMDELVNVYTISGIIVKTNVKRSEALNGLKKGTYYIVGHEKVLVDL